MTGFGNIINMVFEKAECRFEKAGCRQNSRHCDAPYGKRLQILMSTAAAVIMAAVCSVSCTKDRLETTYSNQEKKIESFISQQLQKEGVTVAYANGSNRVTLVQGEGDELSEKGTVTFFYAAYTFSGSISASNLFATNHKQTAEDSSWSGSEEAGDFEALTMNLKDDEMLKGLKMGLKGVKGGEECYIIFSGKYGFGNKNFGTVAANSALLYHIWVSSVSNE